MAGLRVERPPEFSDDERWWGFFSRKTLIVALIFGVIAVGLCKLLNIFGLLGLGIILGIFLVVIPVGMVIIPVPGNDILNGSGMTLDTMIFNVIVRKKKAHIYIKMPMSVEE